MIITISRQFGSGGRTVGKEVADNLGLKCYDSEIIAKMAEESGFSKDYIEENAENTGTAAWIGSGSYHFDLNYMPSNSDRMWAAQCSVIRSIAKEGPCVIVGRCADYILHDEVPCLRVYIHADEAWRARRIVEVYGETPIDPMRRIREKDKRRASYYRIYTDQKFGDARNFDLSLNSGTFGIETCAEIVSTLYRKLNGQEE